MSYKLRTINPSFQTRGIPANERYPGDPIFSFYVTLIAKSATPVAKRDTSAK
jgi:hypothetical protein